MAQTQSLVRRGLGARGAAAGFIGLALTLLGACIPTIQHANHVLGDFQGPRFDVAAHRFYSFDGAPLGLSAWTPPAGQEPWAVIVALHGMNDYGEAFFPAGPWFAERGVAVFAYDARGFGRSPQRGVWGGEHLITEDVRTAVRVARQMYPHATLGVIGDSMGSATAIVTFSQPNAPAIDRLVLVAPAVWGWSTMPSAYSLALWTGAHTFPWRPVTPPRGVVAHIVASDNNEMLRRIGSDHNMIFATRIDTLYGLVNLMEGAAQGSSRLHGDIAFLYGAHDQIIPRASAEKTAERLPANARTAVYARGYHMLLRDLHADIVYQDILAFLHDAQAPFPSQSPPLRPVRTAGPPVRSVQANH